jgi:hypothetical protein
MLIANRILRLPLEAEPFRALGGETIPDRVHFPMMEIEVLGRPTMLYRGRPFVLKVTVEGESVTFSISPEHPMMQSVPMLKHFCRRTLEEAVRRGKWNDPPAVARR